MNITLVYAHPYNQSLNNKILEEVTNNLTGKHKLNLIDLYKEKFNPVLTEEELAVYGEGKYLDPLVSKYQKLISESDHLFFIFPVWWTIMPAILKGFFDKVFLKHFAYEIPGKMPKGLLQKISAATVITTMSSPNIYYDLLIKNPLNGCLVKGTLKFCGIKKIKWFKLGMVDQVPEKKIEAQLKKITDFCKKL